MTLAPASRRRKDREGPIHRDVLAYLRRVLPDAEWHHSPNEQDLRGPAAVRLVVKARSLGTRKGWPDIEGIWCGQFLSFEVKAEGNYATDDQKATGALIERAGGRYAVVRSIEDVRETLNRWGIPTKEVHA